MTQMHMDIVMDHTATDTEYTEGFYSGQCEGSLRSAQAIVPLVMRLVNPRSVIDVGCGMATWAKTFQDLGVPEVCGVDGDYITRKRLLIAPDKFSAVDLAKPLRWDRRFDLVVCLEVAEHLPEECAGDFIASLVSLGPVVLFSAAIPFQGGMHHVNEQWPEYWAGRFLEHDYVPVDCIRRHVWHDPTIEPWYAQNTLVFVKRSVLKRYPALQAEFSTTVPTQLSMVHPSVYMQWADPARRDPKYAPLKRVLAAIPFSLRKTLRAKLNGHLQNGHAQNGHKTQ